MFETAEELIYFSQSVDYLDQGRTDLLRADQVVRYLAKGLLRREGDRLVLTEEGIRQHELAQAERYSEG